MFRLLLLILVAVVLVTSCVSIADRDRLRTPDFRDFESWYKVNKQPLTGDAGGLLQGKHLDTEGIREVYVNDNGRPVFRGEVQLPFPAGTIIVKDTYYADKGGSRGRRWNITVMRKRESGYDSDNGDWEYVTAGPRGGVRFQGIRSLCIDCHSAAEKDYVFTWE